MKTIINAPDAPAPVGPYNHSVLAGNTLYVSGQIAINQAEGKLVIDNIEAETHQVMKNMGYILSAAGMTFEKVVKCSVFVANLPKYVNVEVSCIAVK